MRGPLEYGAKLMFNILILDDDPVCAKIWSHTLRKAYPNTKLWIYPSVASAINAHGDYDNIGRLFNLIILDIFLSGDETGLEFATKLSSTAKDRMIVCSSISHSDFLNYSEKHTFEVDFIKKPINLVACDRVIQAKLKTKYESVMPQLSTEKNDIAHVLRLWGYIDVLVNVAGCCYRSIVEHMDDGAELTQMRTNYLGPIALIRAVIPTMRENHRGKIINVSSVSGIMGMPTMASYSASKHALEGASEALWYELRPHGIDVTVFRPGFINSNGYERVRVPQKALLAKSLNGPYANFYDFMNPFVKRMMAFSLKSDINMGREIIHIIQTQNPPLWYNATSDAVFFDWVFKLLPRRWANRIISAFLDKQMYKSNSATADINLRSSA